MKAVLGYWKVLLAVLLVAAAVFIYTDKYETEKADYERQVQQMDILTQSLEKKIQENEKYAGVQDKLEDAKAEIQASRLDLYQKFPVEMREEDQIMYVLYLETVFKEEIFFTFSEAVALVPLNDGATLHGMIITVNYETTYQGFQDMINYLAEDSRIVSVYEATIDYDEKKDLATGQISLLVYLMATDAVEYLPPDVAVPNTGKDNIFE